MSDRERAVAEVVKRAVERRKASPLANIVAFDARLDQATDALIALDSLAGGGKGLKFGAKVVAAGDGFNVESADHVNWMSNHTREWNPCASMWRNTPSFPTEAAALAALDACRTPPPGWVEPTPAPALVTDARGPTCPQCGMPGSHYVPPSMGESGFYLCQRTPSDLTPAPVAEKPLAERVAELERRAEVARHDCVALSTIAALRREVEGISRRFDGTERNLATRLSVVESNMNAAMGEGREPTPTTAGRYTTERRGDFHRVVRKSDGLQLSDYGEFAPAGIDFLHDIALAVAAALESRPA